MLFSYHRIDGGFDLNKKSKVVASSFNLTLMKWVVDKRV